MSITCGNCGQLLDDDGSCAFDDDVDWCDSCEDHTPHEDGICRRCSSALLQTDDEDED